MSTVRSLAERGVAIVELGLSVILSVCAAAAFNGAYFPNKTSNPSDPANWEAPAWAALACVVLVPGSLLFAIGGITMLKKLRYRWWCQLLPLAATLGALLFLMGPWK